MVAVADLYGSTGFGVATASVAPPVLTAPQLANASRTQAREALETGNADAAKQVGNEATEFRLRQHYVLK